MNLLRAWENAIYLGSMDYTINFWPLTPNFQHKLGFCDRKNILILSEFIQNLMVCITAVLGYANNDNNPASQTTFITVH